MTVAPTSVAHSRRVFRHRLVWLVAVISVVAIGLIAAREWGSNSSSGVVVGSGTPASETRGVPAFATVELAGANDVVIRVGGKQSVVVSGDDNLLALVTTEVRDGALVIGADRSFQTVTPMTVEVTTAALDGATLAGTGEMNVVGVEGALFTARLSGSGVLRASGTVDRVDAELAGSGDLKLQYLVARDATAVVSGAGRLQVWATETLDASLSGTGEILYVGDPATVTKSLTGTGVITPRSAKYG